MLDIAPDLRIVDITHDSRRSTCGPARSRSCGRCSTCPKASCSRSSIPGRHRPALHRGRGRERGSSSAPTTACSRRRSRCSAGRAGSSSSTNPEYQLPAPGPDVRGPRRDGARRPRTSPPGVPIDALGPEVDPASLAPGARAAAQRRRRRVASRARCSGSTATATASSTSRPSSSSSAGVDAGRARSASTIGGERAGRARWVRTFADAKPSELVVLVDSYGMCTLALDRRSAAAELEAARPGTTVDARSPLGRGGAR